MHRRAPLQVGQRKSGFAVATVCRTQQRKERGILREWHQLPVTPCPTLWGEVEGKDANLSNKWICHGFSFTFKFGHYALDRATFGRLPTPTCQRQKAALRRRWENPKE